MSRPPVNNSYYPLLIGANGQPPRSPPPFSRSSRPGHSPHSSFGDRQSHLTSEMTQEVTIASSSKGKTVGNSECLLVRHPDLWFSDGSIVLRAENTLFRVHKSLLARHSGFFQDLFTLPQLVSDTALPLPSPSTPPVQPSGDVEGCQVLRLHDAPEDVANLLTALVDGPNFGNNDPGDFQIVSGVFRLATKYLVDSLREKALNHLSVAWPMTLKGWDAREDTARSLELRAGSAATSIYPSPIAVINLAREVNAPSLLPSAFYDLSRYHFSQIFDHGESFEDSAWQCPLSSADMQRLALGKEASRHAITTLIQSMGSHAHSLVGNPFGYNPYSQGHTHRSCKRDFSELIALATQHYLFDHERGCTDPLYVAEELGQPLYDLGQPQGADDYGRFGGSRRSLEQAECQACAKALETWAQRERERMWKMIPLWFRLDV
ncbi:hypothetical protein PAXINDRAFT_106264 [Paxillus involutus ATCC 200175]|nr:hypothetical protein PAXINDRAFT_106264 [Paxillus involutus ATCC 200175]